MVVTDAHIYANRNSTNIHHIIYYYKKKYDTCGFATKADKAGQPETGSEVQNKQVGVGHKRSGWRPNPWQAT